MILCSQLSAFSCLHTIFSIANLLYSHLSRPPSQSSFCFRVKIHLLPLCGVQQVFPTSRDELVFAAGSSSCAILCIYPPQSSNSYISLHPLFPFFSLAFFFYTIQVEVQGFYWSTFFVHSLHMFQPLPSLFSQELIDTLHLCHFTNFIIAYFILRSFAT